MIQNNKYVAFKGIIDGVLSFPISGCINIDSNIKSPVMKCTHIKNIVDLRRSDLEMVIIPPECFSKKRQNEDRLRLFRIMLNSRIVLTSDKIKAWDLFMMMRKTEKAHPKGEFSGLSEKIVIQLEHEDFMEVVSPKAIEVNQSDFS